MSLQSWSMMESTEVKITSRHHPATPHLKKFLHVSRIYAVVFMGVVCAGYAVFYAAGAALQDARSHFLYSARPHVRPGRTSTPAAYPGARPHSSGDSSLQHCSLNRIHSPLWA